MKQRRRALALAGPLVASMIPLAGQTTSADSSLEATTQPRVESTSFTVMTWNIHVGVGHGDETYDLAEIRDRIVEDNDRPDVVLLQEIHRAHDPGEKPPNEPPEDHGDQIEQMKEWLADEGYVDFYAPQPVEGEKWRNGQMIASRFPLSHRKAIRLPKAAGNHKNKLLIKAKVHLPDGDTVRVYGTHLQSGYGTNELAGRRKQVRAIRDKRTVPRLNEPVVLVGDFNLRPSTGLKSQIADRGFMDTWTMVEDGKDGMTHPGMGITDCSAESDEGVRRIDYVFGSPAIDVVAGDLDCEAVDSDHKPLVMTLRVDDKADQIESSGSVHAGAKGKAGWAHLILYEDKTSKLIVCDNSPGDWNVWAWGRMPYRGEIFNDAWDKGSHRDRCIENEPGERDANFQNAALKTCLYGPGGAQRDCRKHGMLERTYLGEEHRAGYVQYRVGVDNWVTAEVCDTKPDDWAVRARVWDGLALAGDLVAKREVELEGDADKECRSVTGPWPWASKRLTTETCQVRDGEERGCRNKPMARNE